MLQIRTGWVALWIDPIPAAGGNMKDMLE